MPHGLAVAVVALTVVLLLCGGWWRWSRRWSPSRGSSSTRCPSLLDELRRNPTVNDLVERYDVVERVQGAANAETVGRALGGVLGGAQLIFGTVFRTLTVLVLTIYFLAYFDKLRSLGYSLVPGPGGSGCS